MEFDSIRPILSGVVGGIIAMVVGAWWKRSQPSEVRWARQAMLQAYKGTVYLASFFVFAGIIAALLLYVYGDFEKSDLVPGALGFGGGCCAAILTLVVFPLASGRNIRHAFIAFTQSEQAPASLVYAILGSGVVMFVWALVSYMGGR
jgi:nitrate reductase gamma subunit